MGIYGPLKLSGRHLLWEYIISTCCETNDPWVLIGDFNQVLYPEDKYNSSTNLPGADAFEKALFASGLTEIKTNGVAYSWTNNRKGEFAV